ncbi:30S ribosome-binding factor RbfA [Pseudofrankia inefficax]|uniref:Ribosome-binding factor A n=1 Tax=Pseudofrankia inefficax (strain DSM 45817 / CECT 9037 / DDB 130130 / EuI1c) TaxID=298654 RepID=E3J041_PSEI1|nr:30S ribosome-binding factor RbfA [Pseudofrankia inefficax]ADP79177.1 ribosome-binding factor A [Pseudofrankia inefficax]
MADPARARRLAVRVREVVAAALERGVKDPRLGMVTITDARVTPDLMEATVFYTVYGDDEARADSARALESAKGLLRSQVGKATGVKSTPTLTFVHDRLPDDAQHLNDLLAVARARDAELETRREGASHAGEPDPYRKPREIDDELDDLDDVDDSEYDDFGDDERDDEPDAAGPGRSVGGVGR